MASKPTNNQYTCICGERLTMINEPTKLYGDRGASCDECHFTSNTLDIMWHCDKEINETHFDGFDLCNSCAPQFNQYFKPTPKQNDTELMCDARDDVSKCQHLQYVQNIVRKFNEFNRNGNLNSIGYFESAQEKIITILNSANHLLLSHDKSDEHFEFVYNAFGGECKLNECVAFQRHHRIQHHDHMHSDNNLQIYDLLDTLHCHFQHGYDIGSRLTIQERKHIVAVTQNDEIKMDTINYVSMTHKNNELIKLSEILQNKTCRYQKFVSNKRFDRNNKFSSNFTASSHIKNAKTESVAIQSNDICSYSRSFNFNYWAKLQPFYQFRDFQHQHTKGRYLQSKDLYVGPKFSSLKNELLNNKIHQINLLRYSHEMAKAVKYVNTNEARKCTPSITDNGYRDLHYWQQLQLTQHHILVIIIYCGTNEFQRRFSETYRALSNNEDFESVKKRHANFHHFAKYLNEAVTVYGKEYLAGNIKIMYHGINTEMVFDATQCRIFGVLSTTSSYSVAVQFSQNVGMIVELIPNLHLKYFDCCWLSRHSNESELLFVGGTAFMNFINITNCIYGWESRHFITALRYIDSMTNANYFNKDPSIVHKIAEMGTKDIDLLGISDISNCIKLLVKKLINHELNRYLPQTYGKWNKLHPYIDKLLHQICLQKIYVSINCKAFDVDVLKFYQNGYIGYKYLKSFLFLKDGINLEILNALFPSLTTMKIYNLTEIQGYLDNVLNFLKNYKTSKITHFAFETYGKENILRFGKYYQQKFDKLGFFQAYDQSLNGSNTITISRY